MKIQEKLQSFIKSMGGEEPDTASSPKNEPAQDAPAQEIPNELLEKVQTAIEAGELELTEEALKSFCSENGFTEEQTQMLWEILSGNLDPEGPSGEPEPAQDPQPSTSVQKSGIPDNSDLIDFQKSISAQKTELSLVQSAVGALIDDNNNLREILKSQKAESDKEILFLKSKLGIMEKTPDAPKTVATDPSHIPSDLNKAEIKKILFKAAQESKISIGDFTEFDVNGVQTETVKLFLKSNGGQN